MAEAKEEVPTLPPKGRVQSVRQQWSVHEDGALAYRIQNEEIDQHYGLNRFHRRTVREDIPVAKVVQTEEECRQQEERMMELAALKAQADEDEKMAKQMSHRLQRYSPLPPETDQALDDEVGFLCQVSSSGARSESDIGDHGSPFISLRGSKKKSPNPILS
ncbi:uncharacterized protein LOC106012578 [Aplysia californica]|uniref:Uncharacterized protein LOC106012578 n=1 Tax=Aplysia californica TaxID=6500 RepID=A0ABM1A5T3_APLCA|nr:uncharacterized protein LOC106012578 [Aplysia californica]